MAEQTEQTGIPFSSEQVPETVISSSRKMRLMQFAKDLYQYRELFRAFVIRDLKVRYKQTALGVVWVVLQPLISSGVLALVIRKLQSLGGGSAGGDEDFMTSTLRMMAVLVPWMTFQMAVSMSAGSLMQSANLVTKIYFPRLIVPLSFIVGSALDYCIAMSVFFLMAAFFGLFSVELLTMLPLLLLIQLLTAGGLGITLSSLNAQYHDVKYAIPFLLMLGMFLTVFVPYDSWENPVMQFVLLFNPMIAVVDSYRNIISGSPMDWQFLGIALAVSAAFLLGGIAFFQKRDRRLVDII
mgnify:CR=1 FL=1